jgi:hypothetical protein
VNLYYKLQDQFGAFCANGDAAAQFRHAEIDPFVSLAQTIEFDFSGVRNINSSFCNALVANLVEQHSPEILKKVRFSHCRPHIQTMVASALNLGLQRHAEGSIAHV